MQNSFHNSVDATGQNLIQFENRAKRQDEYILEFYKANPERDFTADEVFESLFKGKNVPITSIRRAITNLTDKKDLYKSGKKRKGAYGMLCHAWKFNANKVC